MTTSSKAWSLGILLGGESRRMGSDKALLSLGSESLLERTARRLSVGAEEVLLSVGTSPRDLPPSLSKCRQTLDDMLGEGPLIGLASLLEASQTPWVLVVPCDQPLLDSEHVSPLFDNSDSARGVHFAHSHRPRPFPLLIHTDCLGALLDLIGCGSRRLVELLDAIGFSAVAPSDQAAEAVDFNLNTPEDLKRWRDLERRGLVDGP